MNKNEELAALEGWAHNRAVPFADRLQAAQQVIDELRRRLSKLTDALRELDRLQHQTDEDGGAEVAWYYFRDDIEKILSLPDGTLNTYVDADGD